MISRRPLKRKGKLRRKSDIKKLKDKLMNLVKAYVKERDNYTCQHCMKKVEGSNCHVSHVIPVSAGNALSFDTMNMKILCYHCHINWWHKNPIEAMEWFESKFPDRFKYLVEHRHDTVHWKAFDYEQMIAEWKESGRIK